MDKRYYTEIYYIIFYYINIQKYMEGQIVKFMNKMIHLNDKKINNDTFCPLGFMSFEILQNNMNI